MPAADPFEIRVDFGPDQGTIDILSAADPGRAAFCRVLPNGGGCELLLTLFFSPGASEADIAKQMGVVEQELQSVRGICEHSTDTLAPPRADLTAASAPPQR